jgi:hypothetical protein
MLHPEIIKAASIGCPGWGPAVPVGTFNGRTLPYPEGVSDLQTLVQQPFNADAFRSVPLQVWVGDEDYNVDPWWNLSIRPWRSWSTSRPPVPALAALRGRLLQRHPMAQLFFPRRGMLGGLVMKDFSSATAARRNRPCQASVLQASLRHVASDGHWETEIAL